MYYIEENKAGDSQKKQDFSLRDSGEREILTRYEQADFFKRLCIYLQYRDMRRDFTEIDTNDYKKGASLD